jgi:butyrate kinase
MNELTPEARVSGLPLFEREVVFHALNQKMVARTIAGQDGKRYEDCNFIVAHLGGGGSVGAHHKGRVIEVNDCSGSEGCFSPTRVGGLPARKLAELCLSGQYSGKEIMSLLGRSGGVLAYLGTADMRAVQERMAGGDEKAGLIFRAMAYGVAKQIGGCFAALNCAVDYIIITGGIAHSREMVALIRDRIGKLAPVKVVPGELESEALAAGALRILRQEEELAVYGA